MDDNFNLKGGEFSVHHKWVMEKTWAHQSNGSLNSNIMTRVWRVISEKLASQMDIFQAGTKVPLKGTSA